MGWFSRKEWKVTPTGRSRLEYREGDKTMQINSERLIDSEHELVVELGSITVWDPPNAALLVTDADKERIEANLREALSSASVLWER